MEKLVNAYNPAAAANVMCRNTISIGWDGYLYDCDFNQMLDLKVRLCLQTYFGIQCGSTPIKEISLSTSIALVVRQVQAAVVAVQSLKV